MKKFDFEELESGEEFESLCEDLLRLRGFNLDKRASCGPDQGADIIASKSLTDDMRRGTDSC